MKKICRVFEFSQSQWLNLNVEFNRQKEQKQKKVLNKMEKRCTN